MVADLLDHEPRGAGSAADLHLQVTGKVALQSGSSATNSTASPSSSPSAAVQTSVIRRGPDSPDSNHEDSTWFLRQVLQQQQQTQRESGAGTPLTPATSPVRGVRRTREDNSDEEERDEDEEELKKNTIDEEEDEIEEEKKRARVESIITTMRTSTPAINGCKKRKLYQPQQHGQQPLAKFTSEGEEEEEDDRNDSMSEQEMARAQASSRSSQQASIQQAVHDPIRSLQERIASLHQQRFAALQQQQMQQQQREKPVEHVQPQPPVRRPVRDDAGRTRNPLHQPQFARSATLPGDLSHVSQAHAAYLDATRRLLMEQQRQQPVNGRAPQTPAAPQTQQPKEPSIPQELEGLAEMLKSELASSLAQLVDSTLSRFAAQQQQRRNVIVNNSKSSEESELSKLQRGRVIDRGLRNGDLAALGLTNPFLRAPYGALPHLFQQQPSPNAALNHIVNSIGAGIHPAAAAAAAAFVQQQQQQQGSQQGQSSQAEDDEPAESGSNEQDEALSLVVSPKKKRVNNNNNKAASDRDSPAPGQNVETRLSPLEISLMNHSSANSPPPSRTPTPPSNGQQPSQQQQARYNPAPSASSQPAGPPPPLLHHPSLFTNYSAYFAAAAAAAAAGASQRSKSPANELDLSSPSTSSLLHPALLASHHQHPRHAESIDRQSESSDRTSPYGSVSQSSTLTPMHLRKAKLMFFWCRYPSSSVLKTFFPDVNFNKNNTAQLVKWFSNFR